MEKPSVIIEKYFTDLDKAQKDKFDALPQLYTDWNSKINVISRKDIDSFTIHHLLHSLSIAAVHQFNKNEIIMDLGTGGGFPGLPLAIIFPDTEFVLVDSINKKLKVIEDIAQQLNIKNIKVKHSRAEDMPKHSFDMIVSRAVAPLDTLIAWSKKLVNKSKKDNVQHYRTPGLICLKGGDLSSEIHKSGTKPYVWEVNKIFNYDYFNEKYILYVPY